MADGYLTFDTRLNSEQFQVAVQKLGAGAAKAIGNVLKGLAIAVAVVGVLAVSVAAVIIRTVVGAVIAAAKAMYGLFMKLYGEMSKMEGFKDRVKGVELAFANLKNAAFSAIMPLFDAVLPLIMTVVNWLIEAANAAAAFIAALTGASTYMVYVATSTGAAADSSGQWADNMERGEGAAKGALAGFDKLNVLQQDTDKTGGGGGGGAGSWIEKPISNEIAAAAAKTLEYYAGIKQFFADVKDGGWEEAFRNLFKVPPDEDNGWTRLGTFIDKIKQFFSDLKIGGFEPAFDNLFNLPPNALSDFGALVVTLTLVGGAIAGIVALGVGWPVAIIAGLVILGVAIYRNWGEIKAWFIQTWEDIKAKAIEVWDAIKAKIEDVKGWIVQAWTDVKEWVNQAWTDIKDKAIEVWDAIKAKVTGVWNDIKGTWSNAESWFNTTWTNVKTGTSEMWGQAKDIINKAWTDVKSGDAWGEVEGWFENAWTDVKSTTGTKWDEIGKTVRDVWDGPEGIKTKWDEVAGWFETSIWNPIKTKAGEVWESVSTGAMKIGVNVANGVVTAVNGVIGFINGMIGGLQDAINGLINLINTLPLISIPNITLPTIGLLGQVVMPPPDSGSGSYGDVLWGYGAAGAVIPPNAPFPVIYGDQRSGKNLESPESLMRQIVREETAGAGGQNITIRFTGSMAELVRQLKPEIEKETARVGGTMATRMVKA